MIYSYPFLFVIMILHLTDDTFKKITKHLNIHPYSPIFNIQMEMAEWIREQGLMYVITTDNLGFIKGDESKINWLLLKL